MPASEQQAAACQILSVHSSHAASPNAAANLIHADCGQIHGPYMPAGVADPVNPDPEHQERDGDLLPVLQ